MHLVVAVRPYLAVHGQEYIERKTASEATAHTQARFRADWTAAGLVDKPRPSFEHRRQLVSSQRFSPEFKEEAVRQVVERGYGVPDVAARLGVSAHSLYKWVKAASPDRSEQQSKELLEAKSEVLRLRSQLRRTEEERDLLKKAARYFAREPE